MYPLPPPHKLNTTAVEAVAEEIPNLTPVPNVEKDDSGFLTGSDEEDGEKKPVTSKVTQRSEMPRDQATTMPEEKKGGPVSELDKRAAQGTEGPPKGEASMSVEDQGVVHATPPGEDGVDKMAISLNIRGGDVHEENLVGIMAGKRL